MFEKAAKIKLRFSTPIGNLSPEDLWDVPLTNATVSLDTIAKDLNKSLKENDEESFVVKKTNVNPILKLQFEIVKRVISLRLEAIEKREKITETKAKKEKLMALILEKQDDDLKGMSTEELTVLMNDL